jgi:hypothetical protein
MTERGISPDEVGEAVARGTRRKQANRIVASYRYFDVVYRPMGDAVLVITVMERW